MSLTLFFNCGWKIESNFKEIIFVLSHKFPSITNSLINHLEIIQNDNKEFYKYKQKLKKVLKR